ncbi:MAG: hypothetical protein H7239_06760 [Flavobacterium sp.]|nr:hypothetical protein [Flavobacterium sp.]
MTNKKRISILIGIIGLLIILLAGSIGFIMGNYEAFSKSNNVSASPINNTKVLKDIEDLKLLYDAKIADKTLIYNNLQSQKDSIASLVKALEKSKSDANSLLKYKTQFKSLEAKMRILVGEIVVLKTRKSNFIDKKQPQKAQNSDIKNSTESNLIKNENVQIQKNKVLSNQEISLDKNENTIPKLDELFGKVARTKNDVQNEKIEISPKKVEKFTKITLSNVKATALISKSATKKIETNESSKTDLILIQFTLDENENAKSGDKLYYFQIIDGKNNVLGKRVTQYFDNESLTYSFSKSFGYETKSVNVTQEFLADKFVSGTYRVNIYDRDELVGKTTFVLK